MTGATTVIIPTLGTRGRELDRAIVSVTAQSGASTVPLVVVNGDQFDPDLVAHLKRMPGLRCVQLEAPGVSNARLEGRRLVETPYFAFLDDDDELLPNALRLRIDTLIETSADVVATNGYRQTEDGRNLICSRFDSIPDDPARALLDENWLASAGGLYQTDSVGPDLFEGLPDFLEMTLLGFLLSHQYKVVRLNQPTFVIHGDSADRASESWRYVDAVPRVLHRMQRETRRGDLRRRLKDQRAAALHKASEFARKRRQWLAAWKYHLQSLVVGDGLKYLPYSRHIVRGRRPL